MALDLDQTSGVPLRVAKQPTGKAQRRESDLKRDAAILSALYMLDLRR